jgi:hypothetical protein
MPDNTFVVSFLDKEHEPIRIHAETVEAQGDSYAFLEDQNVVAMVPRNVVCSVVEECSLDEAEPLPSASKRAR